MAGIADPLSPRPGPLPEAGEDATLDPALDEEDEEYSRREIDALIRFFGGPGLPVSQSEVEDAATALLRALELQDFLRGTPFEGFVRPFLDKTIEAGARQFQSLVLEKWGAQAPGSAFAIFSELLRPPTPRIEEKPTAEEFLSDFNTAFTAEIEAMREAGELTGVEAQYAYDVMRPGLFREYTAKLAKFAQAGASPFQLREVSREERGVAPGTTAGRALGAAVGVGVGEPTRVREELAGTAEEITRRGVALRERVEDIGVGVPREFIALPRLMPADFLRDFGPRATDIRLRYAGDIAGAGARRRPQGAFVSSPRRV